MRTSSGTVLRPALRLVGSGGVRDESRASERARQAVERENRAASLLGPEDVRRVFAAKVAGALDGGRAALLTPERRRELVAAAVSSGLRPFEANLVIAIVQDGVRQGEVAVSERSEELLTMIRPGGVDRPFPVALVGAIVCAVSLAALLVLLAVSWLLRG